MPANCQQDMTYFNNIIENYNKTYQKIYSLKQLLVLKLKRAKVRDASMNLSFEQLIHMVNNIPSVLRDIEGNKKPTSDVYEALIFTDVSAFNLSLYKRSLHYIKWLKYYLLLKGVEPELVYQAQTLRDYIMLIPNIIRIKGTIIYADYRPVDEYENEINTNIIYTGSDNPINIVLVDEDNHQLYDGVIVVEEDGEIIQRTFLTEVYYPQRSISQWQIMLNPTQLGSHTYTFYYEETEQYLESNHVNIILNVQQGEIYLNVSILNATEESNYYNSEDTGYIDDIWDIHITTTTQNGTIIPNSEFGMLIHDNNNTLYDNLYTDDEGYYNINNILINKYNSDNNNQPIQIEFWSYPTDNFDSSVTDYFVNIYHYPYIFEQSNEYASDNQYIFTLKLINEQTGAVDAEHDEQEIDVTLNNNEQRLTITNGQCQYTYPASLEVGNYVVTWHFVPQEEDEGNWDNMSDEVDMNGE